MKRAKGKRRDRKAAQDLAEEEYARMISLYKKAGADEDRLAICDRLVRKVAELYATLERMKDLPAVIFDRENPALQRETAAGKARVKYMAQYTNAMQKLNKELCGGETEDDGGLEEFE